MGEVRKWHAPDHVRIHLGCVPVIDEGGLGVDHLAIVRQALALGYPSVMVDGSRLALQGNIKATRQVVELAHEAGVPCKAELGAVFGHELGLHLGRLRQATGIPLVLHCGSGIRQEYLLAAVERGIAKVNVGRDPPGLRVGLSGIGPGGSGPGGGLRAHDLATGELFRSGGHSSAIGRSIRQQTAGDPYESTRH